MIRRILTLALMVLGPLAYRGRHRLEFTIVPYVFLLAMSCYYYVDNTHGALENLLTGARLLIPVFPFWLVTYAWGLERVVAALSIRHFRLAILAIGISGAALTVAVSAVHQRHLEGAAAVRSVIYDDTSSALPLVINPEAAKFISPAWGNRLYTFLPSDPSSSWAGHGSQIVVTTQLGSTERNDDWQAAQQLARKIGDVLVLDRVIGDWRVGIWEPVSWSVTEVVP